MLSYLLQLAILSLISEAEVIDCAGGYIPYLRNSEARYLVCDFAMKEATFNPSLPAGLTFVEGVIRGTPLKPFKYKKFVVFSGINQGFLYLTSSDRVTTVGRGMDSQVIYSETYFQPIKFIPDCYVKKYTISPALPDGMEFDPEVGMISGLYKGDELSVTYTITASTAVNTIEETIQLHYQRIGHDENKGYTICYYDQYLSSSDYNDVWFTMNDAINCAFIHVPLNFTENYPRTEVHEWPGLDNRVGNYMIAVVYGYMNVVNGGECMLRLRGRDAIRLFVDDADLGEIGLIGGNLNTKEISVNLTAGYHLFRVRYFHTRGESTLSLELKEEKGQYRIIDNDNSYIGGKAPYFVAVSSIASHADSWISTPPITSRGSYMASFAITPKLPDGLQMNLSNGTIYGSIHDTYFNQFTITSSSPMGFTSVPLSLSVAHTPLPGLRGKYYTVDPKIDVCLVTAFQEDDITLIVERTDLSLDFGYQNRHGFWKDTPSSLFQGKTYVRWEGLIYVDTAGKWFYRFLVVDTLMVAVDDKILINGRYCDTKVNERIQSLEFAEAGYHSIVIEWASNNNDFSMTFDVRRPGATEYKPMDKNRLFHYPQDVLTTSIKQSSLLTGKSLSIVSSLYGIAPPTVVYSIVPSLPKGLSLHAEKGVIQGTPTKVMETTEYTLAALAGGKNYTTTLLLDVYQMGAPEKAGIFNSNDEPISEVAFMYQTPISPLRMNCTGEACSLSLAPKQLPEGLYLKYEDNYWVIYGTPTKVTDAVLYTLTARNEAGNTMITFSLSVPPCQYGHFHYTKQSNGDIDLYVYRGQELVHKSIKVDSKSKVVLCLPPELYEFRINGYSSDWIYEFRLYRDDGALFGKYPVRYKEWLNTTIDYVIHEKATLSFTSYEVSAKVGEELVIPFVAKGIFVPITTVPALPEDASFDYEKGYLKMKYTKATIDSVVFTIANDVGANTATVVFFVDKCYEDWIHLEATVSTHCSNYYELYDMADGRLVSNHSVGYLTPDKWMHCLKQSTYRIVIHCSESALNSNVKHLYFRNANNTLLGMYNMETRDYTINDVFAVYTPFSGMQYKVKYDINRVSNKWYLKDFDDRKWELMSSANTMKFDKNRITVLLRSTFYYSESTFLPSIPIRFKANGGFLLFVNGFDEGRVDLPRGGIDGSTMALNDAFSSKNEWREMSISTNHLVVGLNVIAIELHCYSTLTPYVEPIAFEMQSEYITTRSKYLAYEGTASGSTNHPDPQSRPQDAFNDENDYTYWQDTGFPSWLRWTFPENRRESVSRVVIRGYITRQMAPLCFGIYGIVKEAVWSNGILIREEVADEIGYVNDQHLFLGSDKVVTEEFKVKPLRPYHAIQLTFNEAFNSSTVRINDVKVYADQYVSCAKEKSWEEKEVNSVSYGSCPFLRIGQSTRSCSYVDGKGVWGAVDTATCLSRFTEKDTAFIDFSMKAYNCGPKCWGNVKASFIALMVREVTIKYENVHIILEQDCTDFHDRASTCFHVRLIPHQLAKEYVKMEVEVYLKNVTALVQAATNDAVELTLTSNIDVYSGLTGKELAYVITILVLVLFCLFLLVLYCRASQGKRGTSRKQLKKKELKLGLMGKKKALSEPLTQV